MIVTEGGRWAGYGAAAYHSGAGPLGSILVGLVAGPSRWYLDRSRVPPSTHPSFAPRSLLFAAPAMVAGCHATLGLAHIGVPSDAWREVFAVIDAVITGVTAWMRMTVFAEHCVGAGCGRGSCPD